MTEFTPECFFCDGEPSAHVDTRSGHEIFTCEEHFGQLILTDQITEHRLVSSGVDKVLKAYDV